MQQNINTQVPAKLIEAMGTADAATLALYVGKKVRFTQGPDRETAVDLADAPMIVRAIVAGSPAYKGAEGEVIHVGENGSIWADFGDDEGVIKSPEGRRVVPLGWVDDPAEKKVYEFIEG